MIMIVIIMVTITMVIIIMIIITIITIILKITRDQDIWVDVQRGIVSSHGERDPL